MKKQEIGKLRINKKMKFFLLPLLFSCSILAQTTEKTTRNQLWLEDYQVLRNQLTKSYANLEFLLKYNHINPYELNKKTIEAIGHAKNDETDKQALVDFINTFKDAHLHIQSSIKDAEKTLFSTSIGDKEACERMGFMPAEKKHDFIFSLSSKLSNKEMITFQKGDFPYAIIQLINQRIGIIRISDFLEDFYPEICQRSWRTYRKSTSRKCDMQCISEFKTVMQKKLWDEFYKTLQTVKGYSIDSLIIDLTNNGGGTDWVQKVATILTKKPLKCGKKGFIKHPFMVKIFQEELADSIKHGENKNTIWAIREKIKVAQKTCNRGQIWEMNNYTLNCSLVAYYDSFEDNYCPFTADPLSTLSHYQGRLFFLVNRNTASAAEDIVARHADNHTATIIGEKTAGAGCGFTNGGISITLPHSGLIVRIPDCIRERADGTNEVAGIFPDMHLNMDLENTDFLKTLLEAVDSLSAIPGRHF